MKAFSPIEKHQDYTGAKMGLWIFLFGELLLFGAMFILYSVFRHWYPQDFHNASRSLNMITGTVHTLVLLTSSLTMVLSITAIQKGNKKLCLTFLFLTILLGLLFMVNKYFEWEHKIHNGIYPGSEFLLAQAKGVMVFFSLYYSMVGIHGLHVIIGIVLLSWIFWEVLKKPDHHSRWDAFLHKDFPGCHLAIVDAQGKEVWKGEVFDDSVKQIHLRVSYHPVKERIHFHDFISLENCGLYWHLVDMIWIFLFPLYYLIS